MKVSFFTLILFLLFQYSNCQNNANIDLDFSKIQKRNSVAGFLHFNDLNSINQYVDNIKPAFWRVGAKLKDKTIRKQQINILIEKKISPIFVVSDLYDWWPWDKTSYGWINPNTASGRKELEELPEMLVNEWGNKIIYDLWNEPEVKDCWKGSKKDFFTTIKIMHDKIRSMPGGENILIAGPSTSSFNKEFIHDFLDYCNNNNVRIDILTWHQLEAAEDALLIKDNVKYAQDRFIKKFPNVKIKQIYIPEIVGLAEQFDPLTCFLFIDNVEKAGITGACKSCWDTPSNPPDNNCWNNSIDGIIDVKLNKPRSPWWFYKYYAESVNNRIYSFSSNNKLLSNFYLDAENNICGLIGNIDSKDISKLTVKIKNIQKEYLFKKKKFLLYSIPNLGSQTLEIPILVQTKKINIKKNNPIISLPNIKSKNLYYIKITE